jgi:hypothetical protein
MKPKDIIIDQCFEISLVDLLIQQSSGVPSGTYFYILNYTSVDNNGKL